MNNSHKIKSLRGNVLDIALIILVLAVLVCAYVALNKNSFATLSIPTKSADITINITAEDAQAIGLIMKGDSAFLKKNGDLLGEIVSVKNIYKSRYLTDNTKMMKKEYTDIVDGLSITFKAHVKMNENNCYINGEHFITTGCSINVTFKSLSGAKCTALVDKIEL